MAGNSGMTIWSMIGQVPERIPHPCMPADYEPIPDERRIPHTSFFTPWQPIRQTPTRAVVPLTGWGISPGWA